MDISKIIYAIRALGMRGIVRMVQYSYRRENIDKNISSVSPNIQSIIPGEMQDIRTIKGGVKVIFEHATAEMQFLSQDIVRISWEPGKSPVPYTLDKVDWEYHQPFIETSKDRCKLSSDNIKVIINNNGEIHFLNQLDHEVRMDHPPKISGDRWILTTHLKPDEHIYGLGERAGSLNLRPGHYTCWNTDPGGGYSPGDDPLYLSIPIYLSHSSTATYLVYFENTFISQFTIEEDLEVTFDGGMLRYYFIAGSLQTIYERLSALLGRPFFPPRWALGYHQSRWGYRSEADIRKVVKGFFDHDLPISVIHLDIDYMDHYRVFTIDSHRFPGLKRLTKELGDAGIKVVATLNPAVKQDPHYKIFSDGKQKDVFCKLHEGNIFEGISWPGCSVFPDFTSAKVREWWSEQYQFMLDAGISGFWHDMNEPVSMTASGDMTFPLSVLHDMDGNPGTHLEAHNIYGFLMNKAGYEGLRNYAPDNRPWIFSRAGWAGMHQYAWNWTGDVESSWEGLRHTIPTILGLSLSGHAFSGVDIGGFNGNPEAELYLRWFQMAAFLPLFRTHSATGTKPREPWVFGEPTTSIIRNFLRLRYKLLPYYYTLTWEACNTGIPPIRPIFWEAPENQHLWDIDDEFMLGDLLLIAPVVYKEAKTRQVQLPPGSWYSFWDDRLYDGLAQLEIALSLETIPIFIKGGSILPMEEAEQLILHIYPSAEGMSTQQLYSDKGDGYETSRVDKLQSSFQQNSVKINWTTTGEYPFPYSTLKLVVHHKKLISAEADGINLAIENNSVISPLFHSISLNFDR